MVSRESTSGSFRTTFCLTNATRFSILSKLRYSWGGTPVLRPTSTSASSCADMAGSVARRAGPGGPAQTWRAAPQLPQSIPGIGKTSGINLLPVPVQVLFLVLPARFESSLERGLEIRRPKQIHRIVIADWTQCLDNNGEAKS